MKNKSPTPLIDFFMYVFFPIMGVLLLILLLTGCHGNWDGSGYKRLPDNTHWYYRR